MPQQHHWIDDRIALREFCDSLHDRDVVALDTESDHFFAYRPYVALIQLATPQQAVLVDPLALDDDALQPLLAVVDDPSIVKIMHSARNDIGELDRDWGINAANVFDTQLAARFLGYEKFGLNALLQQTAGVSLNKKYQRFDWARRPIPLAAQEYAIGDVVHLFDLRARLLRELEAEGWLTAFQEHMAYLVRTSGYSPSPFDPEDWRKLKGAKELDDVGRAVCAALYTFRHELCDRINRAPLHILDNGTLLRLARQRPRSRGELGRLKGIRPNTLKYNGEEILAVIADALTHTPPPIKRPSNGTRGPRTSPASKERLKSLLALRQQLSEQTKLSVDVVLQRAALEQIADLAPRSTDELYQVEELLNWQRELFGSQLVAAIDAIH